MKEHFLDYTQSLAVKELGFDEPCMKQWTYAPVLIPCTNGYNYPILKTNKEVFLDSGGDCISAPLKSQFFKWVREKYGLYSSVHKNSYIIEGDMNGEFIRITKLSLKNYEQAEDACINKIIELLKLK